MDFRVSGNDLGVRPYVPRGLGLGPNKGLGFRSFGFGSLGVVGFRVESLGGLAGASGLVLN